MNERGEYRSIRRVLLDGPDFQKLSERARWIFVALKLNAGPTGIDVLYPDALAPQLARQTGVPARAIAKAVDELEAHGWIIREANVLWIVGHLKHDPHMVSKDRKHRMAVQRAIASMPRLDIVRRFVTAHPDWFPRAESVENSLGWAFPDTPTPPTEGHRRAIEGPSKHKTETETERETRTRTTTSARSPKNAATRGGVAPAPRDSWLGPTARVWQDRVGSVSFGKFAKLLRPLYPEHSPAEIAEHLERYLKATEPRFVSIARFAETFAQWGPTDPDALVDEWGVLTDRGERETRPSGLKLA